MPAYLVRIIKSQDLVGIFVADDELGLEMAVDECTDTPGCEFTELPDGGIMWESPAKPVPLNRGDPDDDDSEVEPFPWNGASLSERWFYIAYGLEDVEWTPFDDDAPEEPSPTPKSRPPLGPGRVIPIRKKLKL
jgi:hypothetical protein